MTDASEFNDDHDDADDFEVFVSWCDNDIEHLFAYKSQSDCGSQIPILL